MKRKPISILLIIIMVACFAVALSYPIQYLLQKGSNENTMDDLRAMRRSALEDSADPGQAPADEDDETMVSPAGGSVSTEAAVADCAPRRQDKTPSSTGGHENML